MVELTAPVVFETLPDCVPITFTTIVQVVPGVVMLPPDRLMVVVFAVAVTVPLQVLLTPGVAATCKPFVKVSLKAIPFSAAVLAAGFVIVKVSVVVPFSGMVAAPKALLMVGGEFGNRLLQKVDVALQAASAPLHGLFDRAYFDAGDVLRRRASGDQHARSQHH